MMPKKNRHQGKTIFEYDQITEQIYIGTNMCCDTHFKKELLEKGIVADISLEKERLDSPYGVDYFIWLPTKDLTPPSPEQLKLGVDVLNKLVKMKKKIYVHCKNGHGRAPTLVTAYFVSKGNSIEEAIKKIKEKRPSIHLRKNQIKALEKFKKNLCS